MSAIDLNPNCRAPGMLSQCKSSAAELVRKAKEVARISYSRAFVSPIRSPALHVVDARRTFVAMGTNGADPGELDAIFERKRHLRSGIRKLLKNMDPIQRAREDDAIQNIVLESPWFKDSKSLCAYISSAALREVDTSKIVSEVLSDPTGERKKLYVPRVEDNNSNMKMLKLSATDDLTASSMNILEPDLVDTDGNQLEDVRQSNDPVDLFILPGLAFDKSGSRLGRSGGYYDLFLKKYQKLVEERKWKQPLLVGLSYSVQVLEAGEIPVTPYDVPVDAIVSSSAREMILRVKGRCKIRVKGIELKKSGIKLILENGDDYEGDGGTE